MTTPDPLPKAIDIVDAIVGFQNEIKRLQTDVDQLKARLVALHQEGLIPDKLNAVYGSATLTTRTSWAYSAAVKQLQEMEQLEGVATKKTSSSWTIRPATPEQLDF
jgi:cell division septum initiation protein DivIVA